ncbi:hypothetical protein HXA34_20500 [Salipaludibacillus agaradhaerens]|jgi:hypothetical protein|uniref:hypothetical protein n=1 Tax=Salipaludibacillus agaradhaerens TaxID=76935 RepID=UPI002150FF6D|nr:hypothetical protein [Salipaludibacillus agaradhaerens]MCR6108680.1 hypothetical protein [Salipaludibacillus agaradhaerens]MCR6120703.1 hypothetical protein [Salipaludibacillus agaradhaerens]
MAISILKKEIAFLNKELKYGYIPPDERGSVMRDIQKFNRAVNDIQSKFGIG